VAGAESDGVSGFAQPQPGFTATYADSAIAAAITSAMNGTRRLIVTHLWLMSTAQIICANLPLISPPRPLRELVEPLDRLERRQRVHIQRRQLPPQRLLRLPEERQLRQRLGSRYG
jgi:hypothetical protein